MITLFEMIPFVVVSLMHMTKVNNFIKASVDVFAFNLTIYFTNYIVNLMLKIDNAREYAVNLSDWKTYAQGNSLLLNLILGFIISAVLLIIGLIRKKRTVK